MYKRQTQFDPPVMDQNGAILFRGTFADTGGAGGLTTSNDKALFLKTSKEAWVLT